MGLNFLKRREDKDMAKKEHKEHESKHKKGDAVQYTAPDYKGETPEPLHAVVAAVNADGTVNLSVLDPGGNWTPVLNVTL